jgi:hypothetical protein
LNHVFTTSSSGVWFTVSGVHDDTPDGLERGL